MRATYFLYLIVFSVILGYFRGILGYFKSESNEKTSILKQSFWTKFDLQSRRKQYHLLIRHFLFFTFKRFIINIK